MASWSGSVSANSAVDLVVSSGTALIDVPNVIGLDQASAESAIVAAGLTVGSVTTQASETVPAGNVIGQNPTACSNCVAANSTVDLVVSAGATNQAPSITIASPSDNAIIPENTPIAFSASASDPEDGDITASIIWISSKDGAFGSGGSVIVSSLSKGKHEISAQVTDSNGATSVDIVSIRISKN